MYKRQDDDYVIARSHAIADYLREQHHIKALVVACNTATAAAIHLLREELAPLPIVGIEPALKPAAVQSRTGRVGVMATRGTLQSDKFQALLASLQGQASFMLQPCDGLAIAIERNNATEIGALCADYTGAMGIFGQETGQMDTLVLGCTHYPFVESVLRQHIGAEVLLLEGGAPVARQTRRLLDAAGQLAPALAGPQAPTRFYSTGDTEALAQAAARWLGWDATVQALPDAPVLR